MLSRQAANRSAAGKSAVLNSDIGMRDRSGGQSRVSFGMAFNELFENGPDGRSARHPAPTTRPILPHRG